MVKNITGKREERRIAQFSLEKNYRVLMKPRAGTFTKEMLFYKTYNSGAKLLICVVHAKIYMDSKTI